MFMFFFHRSLETRSVCLLALTVNMKIVWNFSGYTGVKGPRSFAWNWCLGTCLLPAGKILLLYLYTSPINRGFLLSFSRTSCIGLFLWLFFTLFFILELLHILGTSLIRKLELVVASTRTSGPTIWRTSGKSWTGRMWPSDLRVPNCSRFAYGWVVLYDHWGLVAEYWRWG